MARFPRFFGNSAGNAAAYGIGAAIHPTLRPITQVVANETWDRFPDVPLTPEQAAAAVERGEMTFEEARAESRFSGTNTARFKIIERLAGLAPSTEQLLSMRRRGAISDARMHKGFVQGNVRSEWADALAALAEVLMTPGEIARLTALGFVTSAQGAALAKEIGVEGDTFARQVELAQTGPSLERLLEAWNRGTIDEGDVDAGLEQEGVRRRWWPMLKTLRRYLPSVTSLVSFSVREAYDDHIVQKYGLDEGFPEEFATAASQQGLEREDALRYWRSHWRLPSPTQGYRMLWRNLLSLDELDELLRVNDYMPFYRDKLRDIAYLVPGRIDLRRFYQAGLITEAEVFEGYKKLGYTDETARWQTEFAKRPPTTSAREATATDHLALYDAGRDTPAETLAAIEGLGYSETEARVKIEAHDARRVVSEETRVITALHKGYIDGDYSETEALTAMTDLGVAEWARTAILRVWNVQKGLA